MVTIQELLTKLAQMKAAISNITVKGPENAEYVAYAYRQCESIEKDLHDTLTAIQNAAAQNTEKEDPDKGEENVE